MKRKLNSVPLKVLYLILISLIILLMILIFKYNEQIQLLSEHGKIVAKISSVSNLKKGLPKCDFDLNVTNCPVLPKRQQNRIIIVSHQRSGSTFTGNLLQTSPKTFYMYEPFGYLGPNSYIDRNNSNKEKLEAMDLLFNLLNCQKFNEKTFQPNILIKSKRYFRMRKFVKKNNNYMYDLTKKFCTRAKNIIYKFVRIDLKFVIDFFKTYKKKSLPNFYPFKILLLFRDPRAILNSRMDPILNFCPEGNVCQDPNVICERIRSNIKILSQIGQVPSEIVDNLVIMRYEDLSKNARIVTKKLFKRLDLNYSKEVDGYIGIQTSLRLRGDGPVRNTSQNAINWINTFKERKMNVNQLQNYCSDVMNILGYKTIDGSKIGPDTNWDQLISDDFPLRQSLSSYFVDNNN